MKKIYKSKILFMLLLLFVCSIMINPIKAKAESYASRYAWRDDSGNIIIRTEDHQRTSAICYQTLGFTITRCELGTQNTIEDQYITVRFNGSLQDVPIGNGYTTSAFVMTESEYLSKIASVSGDWLADIQSEKPCWIMFDAIMCTWDYSLPDYRQFSGALLSDNNQDYRPNLSNPIPGVYDKFTKERLKYHTYGWYDPEKIETHFRIPLLYNGGEEAEPIESDELIARTGKKEPSFYAWNTSDEYDLFDGIPSGEDITSGYGADKWYGNFGIAQHTKEKEYIVSYDFVYHTYHEEEIYGDRDTDGDGINDASVVVGHETVEDSNSPHHYPVKYRLDRIASYYYVLGINLYELTKSDVYNSTYPGDVIHYDIPSSVPMEVELDGEMNPATVIDWTSDEDVHIKWPEPYNSTIVIDCGEGLSAAQAKARYYDGILHDDVITGEDPVKGVNIKNDLVEINGIKYMDNQWVENVVDARTKLIPYKLLTNGKDDATYLFQEESKTVTIPKDVANGSYATDIEVTYKKRVLNDMSLLAFTSATDGIRNHLKPGYEQNEPVYVHTPVISPASITDEEQTTQLINENRSAYSEADNNGNMPDGKAAYELILDNTYTIKFDPFSHDEHFKGYGWSGDPSKYDKYIKGKYVRFPFAIKLNDTFYKPDQDDGYTEWIEIDKYKFQFYIPPWAIENKLWNIQLKVEAYNVDDENGVNHSDATEGSANRELNGNHEAVNYVATYNIPVELSGIIYDFEVLGTDNYIAYVKLADLLDENGNVKYSDIAFCPRKEEKKQGMKNRLGKETVRYTLDGTTTTSWKPENTLPMGMGTSINQKDKGYLVATEDFCFSVKTIANLWDETGDTVEIKPNYRFYDKYGTLHKDIQVYYVKYGEPIRVGSKRDKNEIQYFNLMDNENIIRGSLFDAEYSLDDPIILGFNSVRHLTGDYHDPDLKYTILKKPFAAGYERMSIRDKVSTDARYLCSESPYTMEHLTLNSNMRTLTGNYEELAINEASSREHLALSDFNVDDETDDKMAYSMQTWYGKYSVPGELLVCDADTFEKLGATDQDKDGVIDYYDYLVQFIPEGKDDKGNPVKCVDTGSDFWLTNDFPYGYLMLNFDITTKNNNQGHLAYWSGNGLKDMWKLQGAKDKAEYGSPVLEETTKGAWPIRQINVESGDVAFINPNERIAVIGVQGLFTN